MSNQVIDLNKAQMEQMVTQANSIYQMYNEISDMKEEIIEVKNIAVQTNARTEERLKKIENSYPMLDTEADRLQSIATIKARQFTKEFFKENVSNELFSRKFGHLISGVYKMVKKEFHVRKYTLVRHVEAEKAIAFVESLTLNDLPKNYLRLTDTQKDTAARHGDYGILERLG
ncbi:hypothetical protein [Staphylococcus haemolyticus]|uniref:hypothetical protein n=1 Tax=Staphylococcus haemolyticus TaxID=1283 RepID=UPI001F317442|nr:hypothetical protein [Staphylococcus haemolyticus]MCE4963027.1 ORF6C domain-containing protein [Staphylococcus haemolyticus]MDU0441577.1 hypothetical protein [Staphylococcus haemolyticus]MDU0473695.1 hypothetical protein [Staphylococcus haemolyticus]